MVVDREGESHKPRQFGFATLDLNKVANIPSGIHSVNWKPFIKSRQYFEYRDTPHQAIFHQSGDGAVRDEFHIFNDLNVLARQILMFFEERLKEIFNH